MTLSPDAQSHRAAVNRENSLQSTGPITEAGKQRSSLNALRHGLTGQVVVLPTEDLAAYEKFALKFHDDLQPAGAVETQIVQSLADDAWRLNRAKALENNLYALGLHDKASSILTENDQVRDALAVAAALREQTQALATLSTHQNRIARAFERGLTLLRQLQAQRKEEESAQLHQACRLYQLHLAGTANSKEPAPPYNPAKDGFVFTVPQLERHLEQARRMDRSYQPAPRPVARRRPR